ncbi:hypothetical protein NVP1101O_098 [Vibrio phage 1.101.O._10N.261.45.C6]|nr:hypothetical protein NVP1101O_098 [Vibrio phage 1.101.O._10N.261.45.C6]
MQCLCGRWFTPLYYKTGKDYSREQSLCPTCINASNPISYVNKEWVCGNTTGMVFSEYSDQMSSGDG